MITKEYYIIDIENGCSKWLSDANLMIKHCPYLQLFTRLIVCTRHTPIQSKQCSLMRAAKYPWVSWIKASNDLTQAADVLITIEAYKLSLLYSAKYHPKNTCKIFLVNGGDKRYITLAHQLKQTTACDVSNLNCKIGFIPHQAILRAMMKTETSIPQTNNLSSIFNKQHMSLTKSITSMRSQMLNSVIRRFIRK
jgi:hypothetical protein